MGARSRVTVAAAGVCVLAGLLAGVTGGTAVADPGGTPAGDGSGTVARVIDGEDFVLSDGRHVRVLGIASCDADTAGGRRATDDARALLEGARVRLTAQPGVDHDEEGRLLRYVATPAGDVGEAMVAADHTTVRDDDVSPARLARLRALDGNGRVCGVPGTGGLTFRGAA